MASLGSPSASSARSADRDADARDFVADLASWSAASNREGEFASAAPFAFVPRNASAGAPIRGAKRATVTATRAPRDDAPRRPSGASSSAPREGAPTLADLFAAERKLDGGGGGIFAEAAWRDTSGRHAATDDRSARGASLADREKLLADLRDAPARERRWAAAREKEKGNDSFKAREYRSAIEAYDLAIALDATNPAFFANRAAAYMKLRRWSDAARDCDAALALDPEHFKALLRRGACALEANEENAAETALRDFDACAEIEARRRARDARAGESTPSDAELVRLVARAREARLASRKTAARAATRRVAIEEDDGDASSTVTLNPAANARRGPMVFEEIFEDPDPPAPPPTPPRRKTEIVIQEASDSDDDAASPAASPSSADVAARVAALKDEGNARFARCEYRSAVASYDEAIRAKESGARDESSADSRAAAVLFANRAASFLKLGDFAAAERDANDAVARDASYVKAFHRRAAARAGLRRFEEALEDYEKVVRAAPESEALRGEVNACAEKAAEAMLGGLSAAARGDDSAKAVAIEPDSDDESDEDDGNGDDGDGDDDGEASREKVPIEEAPAAPPSAAETNAPESEALAVDSETPAKAHAVAIVEAEASDDEGRAGENEEARAARGRLENPVAEANEKPPPRAPRAPPRTATEFERGCASLRGDPAALLAFVSSVDDAALPGVLKHSVSATILRAYGIAFGRVVGAPGSPATSDAAKEKTAATLAALAATPRFALAAAALGAADRRAIARVFDALGDACAEETRGAWRCRRGDDDTRST